MQHLSQFYTICYKLTYSFQIPIKYIAFFHEYAHCIYTIFQQIRLPFTLIGLPLLCTSKLYMPFRIWFKFHIIQEASLTSQ